MIVELWLIIIVALGAVVASLVFGLSLSWSKNTRLQEQIEEIRKALSSIAQIKTLIEQKGFADEELDQFGKDLRAELKKMFDSLRTDEAKKVAESAEQAKHEREELTKELAATRKAEIAKIESEIGEYKKKKLAEIDRDAKEVIAQVVKKVIGATIDVSSHEKLILDACEKAKREGFFKA